jgi:hypothetical protein
MHEALVVHASKSTPFVRLSTTNVVSAYSEPSNLEYSIS